MRELIDGLKWAYERNCLFGKICYKLEWSVFGNAARYYIYGRHGEIMRDNSPLIYKLWVKLSTIIRSWDDFYYGGFKPRYVWHSYFEPALGRYVDDPSILRKEEANGMGIVTKNEHERMIKEKRERNEKESREKTKNLIRQSLRELQQGRSFVREQQQSAKDFDRIRRERLQAYEKKQ